MITHTYAPNGPAFSVIDPEGYVQTFSFDLFRRRTWTFDEFENATVHTYNTDGNLLELNYPDRATETFVWQDGLETERVDAFGIKTVSIYSTDNLKNLESVRREAWSLSASQYQQITVLENGTPVDLVTTYAHQNNDYVDVSPSAGYSHLLTGLLHLQISRLVVSIGQLARAQYCVARIDGG